LLGYLSVITGIRNLQQLSISIIRGTALEREEETSMTKDKLIQTSLKETYHRLDPA
jgi:hypothetical protein